MTADYFHMTSDNRISIPRLLVNQQALITTTCQVGGVTLGPEKTPRSSSWTSLSFRFGSASPLDMSWI